MVTAVNLSLVTRLLRPRVSSGSFVFRPIVGIFSSENCVILAYLSPVSGLCFACLCISPVNDIITGVLTFGWVDGDLLPTLTLKFLNMLLAVIRLLPLSLVLVLVFTTSAPVRGSAPLGVNWQPIRIWYLLGTIPAFPLLETSAVPSFL